MRAWLLLPLHASIRQHRVQPVVHAPNDHAGLELMGAYDEDAKTLQQAMDSIAWSKATRQARQFSNELAHMHDAIIASMGVPSLMFYPKKPLNYVSINPACLPTQHPSYVPGKAQGSISLKQCTMDLQAIKAQIMNWGTIAIDECFFLEPSMVNGFTEPMIVGVQPGYAPVCGHCAYSFRCMQGRHPQVCKCCRSSSGAPLFMEAYGHEALRSRRIKSQDVLAKELDELQTQLCRLQTERERVPTACPLFTQSLIKCPACEDKHVRRTYRVWVQETDHRRTLRLRNLTKPRPELRPPTFREHLEHFTKRHAHANTIPRQHCCAQRRFGRSHQKRQAK